MRLDMLNKLGPKGKLAVIGVVVLLGGALVYENVALKGRQIFSQQVSMAGAD